MEVIYENQYELTVEKVLSWMKNPIGESAKKQKKRHLTIGCIGLFCCLFIIILSIYSWNVMNLLIGLILAGFDLWIMFFKNTYIVKKQFKVWNKTHSTGNRIRSIRFGDHIEIQDENMLVTYEYSQLTKLTEDSEYYFVMIGKDLVIRVLKTGFIKGNTAEFPGFIQQRIGDPSNQVL